MILKNILFYVILLFTLILTVSCGNNDWYNKGFDLCVQGKYEEIKT